MPGSERTGACTYVENVGAIRPRRVTSPMKRR